MSQQYQKQKLKWIEKGKQEEREKFKKIINEMIRDLEKEKNPHNINYDICQFGIFLLKDKLKEQLQKEIGGMK